MTNGRIVHTRESQKQNEELPLMLSLVLDYRQMIVYTREIHKQMTTTHVGGFDPSLKTTHKQMTTTSVGVFGHLLQTTHNQMTTTYVDVFGHSLQTTYTHDYH